MVAASFACSKTVSAQLVCCFAGRHQLPSGQAEAHGGRGQGGGRTARPARAGCGLIWPEGLQVLHAAWRLQGRKWIEESDSVGPDLACARLVCWCRASGAAECGAGCVGGYGCTAGKSVRSPWWALGFTCVSCMHCWHGSLGVVCDQAAAAGVCVTCFWETGSGV